MDDRSLGIGRGLVWSATALLIDGSGPRGELFVLKSLAECLFEAGLLPLDQQNDSIIVEWMEAGRGATVHLRST